MDQINIEGNFMAKKENKDTRYFIDIDLKTRRILSWDYGQRHGLEQILENPCHQRVFITKGQYNKLVDKNRTLKN